MVPTLIIIIIEIEEITVFFPERVIEKYYFSLFVNIVNLGYFHLYKKTNSQQHGIEQTSGS